MAREGRVHSKRGGGWDGVSKERKRSVLAGEEVAGGRCAPHKLGPVQPSDTTVGWQGLRAGSSWAVANTFTFLPPPAKLTVPSTTVNIKLHRVSVGNYTCKTLRQRARK